MNRTHSYANLHAPIRSVVIRTEVWISTDDLFDLITLPAQQESVWRIAQDLECQLVSQPDGSPMLVLRAEAAEWLAIEAGSVSAQKAIRAIVDEAEDELVEMAIRLMEQRIRNARLSSDQPN